jgi:Flp pilus assembly protein TadB
LREREREEREKERKGRVRERERKDKEREERETDRERQSDRETETERVTQKQKDPNSHVKQLLQSKRRIHISLSISASLCTFFLPLFVYFYVSLCHSFSLCLTMLLGSCYY